MAISIQGIEAFLVRENSSTTNFIRETAAGGGRTAVLDEGETSGFGEAVA
jgi:hypothetical protein